MGDRHVSMYTKNEAYGAESAKKTREAAKLLLDTAENFVLFTTNGDKVNCRGILTQPALAFTICDAMDGAKKAMLEDLAEIARRIANEVREKKEGI